MRPIYITYLNRLDIEAVGLTDGEILEAIEASLAMQGRGETAIEPRVHLEPRAGVEGHFNVLRGWIGGEIDRAGVKVVGDFVDKDHMVTFTRDLHRCQAHFDFMKTATGNWAFRFEVSLIDNADRKAGHVLRDGSGRIRLVDHGDTERIVLERRGVAPQPRDRQRRCPGGVGGCARLPGRHSAA